jgi:hypothetical protein
MPHQAMEKAISEVPKQTRALTKARPYLLEVADKLQDDILGILSVVASATSDMCLVVTPSRIVGVGDDGSVEVWRYEDVKQVMVVGGKKKLFGGRDFTFFNIYLPNGSVRVFQTLDEYDYLNRIGMLAESACRKAQIANL